MARQVAQLEEHSRREGSKVTMLGFREPLVWQSSAAGLTIQLPQSLQDEKARPCEHAWVVKVPRSDKGG